MQYPYTNAGSSPNILESSNDDSNQDASNKVTNNPERTSPQRNIVVPNKHHVISRSQIVDKNNNQEAAASRQLRDRSASKEALSVKIKTPQTSPQPIDNDNSISNSNN